MVVTLRSVRPNKVVPLEDSDNRILLWALPLAPYCSVDSDSERLYPMPSFYKWRGFKNYDATHGRTQFEKEKWDIFTNNTNGNEMVMDNFWVPPPTLFNCYI